VGKERKRNNYKKGVEQYDQVGCTQVMPLLVDAKRGLWSSHSILFNMSSSHLDAVRAQRSLSYAGHAYETSIGNKIQ